MTSKRFGGRYLGPAFSALVLVGCLSPSSGNVAQDGGSGSPDGSLLGSDGSVGPGGDGSTSGDGGAGMTCGPASVQGYTPRWTPPAKVQSVCTAAQLTSYGACLDAGDNNAAACAPWFGLDASANSGCFACLNDSKQSDPAWGPIIDVGTSGSDRQLNVSGCLAITTNDNSATGCASQFQAFQGCESAACANSCVGASSAALDTCITTADSTGCSSYLSPASCVNEAGAAASACFASGTYGQKFASLAAVFCLQVDGGAP